VVHLATHGQFSSNAEETFILTWDGVLPVNQLGNLLRGREEGGRKAIELLVLSACETATGDRAAIGLAAVAVRSGARSTLATLWVVNDESTADLMIKFYEELKDPKISKAEALRRAQVWLMKQNSRYEDPEYWAPFVLVGNWL
jgi:CHAT domain-containing protein